MLWKLKSQIICWCKIETNCQIPNGPNNRFGRSLRWRLEARKFYHSTNSKLQDLKILVVGGDVLPPFCFSFARSLFVLLLYANLALPSVHTGHLQLLSMFACTNRIDVTLCHSMWFHTVPYYETAANSSKCPKQPKSANWANSWPLWRVRTLSELWRIHLTFTFFLSLPLRRHHDFRCHQLDGARPLNDALKM